ncbi:MAG: DsbE family thiol:disulfide interchange protein, partial [Alphaproteobacteria bacterium]|nr:DsbE family thiol:disulfide interchange protein [Alphaproteobacteria bacterium]
FLQELGNPFADNLSDKNGRVGIDLGVYGVPESFVVAGDGTITYKHIGPILPMHLEQLMLELARAQTVR